MFTVAGTKLIDPQAVLEHIGVRDGARIADLGCGRVGQFVFPAAQIVGEHGVVYAADIQKQVIQEIRDAVEFRHLENVQAIWCDLEKTGNARIPQGTIDVALLVTTLLHAKDKKTMLKEARRLLKDGGKLLVIDWLASATEFLDKTDVDPVDKDEVKKLASSSGFKFLEELSPGKFHFGLVFLK